VTVVERKAGNTRIAWNVWINKDRSSRRKQNKTMARRLCAAFAVILLSTGATAIDCSQFNASNIEIILPQLNSTQVDNIVNDWMGEYGYYFGDTFNATTQTPEPFTWVIRTGLTKILTTYGLIDEIPTGSPVFEDLCASWGHLTPWSGTVQALQKLQTRYKIAALSNGDRNTLVTATSVFFPTLAMNGWYSSAYPVGAFKPAPQIYAQLAEEYGIDRVVHVAGSAIDAFGARSYGLFNALLQDTPMKGPQPCWPLKDITYLPAVFGL
jgi:FMN phosphatase YigB (HAD superfamily)